MVSRRVNFYFVALQSMFVPVELRVKLLEPRVSENHAVPTQVGHVEAQLLYLFATSNPQIAVMGDSAISVDGAVNVVN